MTPTNPDPVAAAIEAIQTASDAIFNLMSAHTHEDGHHQLVEKVGDQTIVIDRACRDLAALASLRAVAHAKGESVGRNTPLSEQSANLKVAFAEADIPWPSFPLNHKDTHLAELLQQCLDAFEVDGGDLNHAAGVLNYLRDRIKWRMRGAESPSPSQTPDLGREAVIEEAIAKVRERADSWMSDSSAEGRDKFRAASSIIDDLRALSTAPGEAGGRGEDKDEVFLSALKMLADREAIRESMWQVLDDMGKDGRSVCGQAKAELRVAFEKIKNPDDVLDYTFEEATAALALIGEA